MEKDIAISVKNVSKTFKIPHEKVSSVRGAVVNVFRKKGYEEFKALDDVSFEVKKGEFFGIIGRNGSGKSTLLKILAGIYQPDKGSVKINGMISPFLELGIGFNPELSGRDNVYLNATVLGMTKKQIDEKFDSIVKFSELERFIDQKLKNYSSGMQVRLAFSVSIHANRDILLMDEVLAVGDSNFQSKCLSEFARYKEMGKTVILVTHDISTVQRYCDRAMLLRNGEIMKIGKADEVGNEYIYQNISDEGSRREREKQNRDTSNQKKDEKKENNKIIELLDVKIFEKGDPSEKTVLLSGSDVTFRIDYLINDNNRVEDFEDLSFGLGIHLEDNNQYCFALNSFIDNIKFLPNDVKKGYVEVHIPKLLLNNGLYGINAIVMRNEIGFNKTIDFFGNISKFSVQNFSYNEGLFSLEHEWN